MKPSTAPPIPLLGGLAAAAALTPLAWWQGLIAEYTLPKLLVLAAGAALAGVGLLRHARRAGLPASPLSAPLTALILVAAASAMLSQDRWQSLLGRHNDYAGGLLCVLLYAALCWAASSAGPAPRRRLLAALAASGAAVAAYAALQWADLDPFTLSAPLPGGRAVSTIGSPVHLGGLLALLWPLTLLFAAERRPAGIAAAVLVAAGLAAAASRGAVLAAAVGGLLFVLLRKPGACKDRRLAAALAAAVALGGLFAARRHASRPAELRRVGDVMRVEGWKIGWRLFLEAPLLGRGLDTYAQGFRRLKTPRFVASYGAEHYHAHAHNDVIEVLAVAGALGLLAYFWLLAAAARAARAAPQAERAEIAALAGGLSAFFCALKFNPMPLETLAPAALMLGLLAPARQMRLSKRAAYTGAALVFAVGLVGLGVAGRLTAADRQAALARAAAKRGDARGLLAGLRRANALQPCQTSYAIDLVNHLIDLLRAAPPALRAGYALEARLHADRLAACRPHEVLAHYTAGYAALIQAQLGQAGRLADAERHLDRAIALAPHFAGPLDLRAQAADLRGDAAAAAKARAELARVQALFRR